MTACNKEAGSKKLEGDARKAFMSDCLSAKPAGAASAAKPTAAATSPACEKSADEKKLAGAARSSHIKKCMADSAAQPTAATTSPACEKSADEKKLAGAARSSHIKKCMADRRRAERARVSHQEPRARPVLGPWFFACRPTAVRPALHKAGVGFKRTPLAARGGLSYAQ